jgi:hypothetical protein
MDRKKVYKYSRSPYMNDNTKLLGIPLSNKDPSCLLAFLNDTNMLHQNYITHLVDMENKTILEEHFKDKIPEVVVNYTDDEYGKYIIDVHFNKTLSEERKKLEKKVNPLSNNIMIIYVDSVSRGNAMRQLKKTLKFFEKFMPYKGNYNEK